MWISERSSGTEEKMAFGKSLFTIQLAIDISL
jgi:hypothetical protein